MEPDQLPHRSCHFLKLPLYLESLNSKRHKVIKRGTHTSTNHIFDCPVMGIELSPNDTRTPSTPIPSVVNGTPLNPSTTMVLVPEIPVLTHTHPMVSTRPIEINPFGSLFWCTWLQFSAHTFGL